MIKPLRLIGCLSLNDPEGIIPFLQRTFPRLVSEIRHSDSIVRHVNYEATTAFGHHLHFLGLQLEEIDVIPEGMLAWELDGDEWTVFQSEHGKNSIMWQGNLSWLWRDDSTEGRPIGEFTAQLPPQWTTDDRLQQADLHIFANGYFDPAITKDDNIHLADYDPSWLEQYERMASWLKTSLGRDIANRMEHYGSTAISGMPAKPVIDILVEVPSFDQARRHAIPLFNKPECEYWWYRDHMCFIVRNDISGKRTHHIHMAPAGHRIWDGLAFRDYLRSNSAAAASYATLKVELSERYREDREGYTDAKGAFVREIMSKIR